MLYNFIQKNYSNINQNYFNLIKITIKGALLRKIYQIKILELEKLLIKTGHSQDYISWIAAGGSWSHWIELISIKYILLKNN